MEVARSQQLSQVDVDFRHRSRTEQASWQPRCRSRDEVGADSDPLGMPKICVTNYPTTPALLGVRRSRRLQAIELKGSWQRFWESREGVGGGRAGCRHKCSRCSENEAVRDRVSNLFLEGRAESDALADRIAIHDGGCTMEAGFFVGSSSVENCGGVGEWLWID